MAIGAGIGITSEASAPCAATILGTYAENPPILPFIDLAGVPRAYGVLVGGLCLLGPSDGRMAFYLAESAGIVGAMQEGKLVAFPVTELGFGAKATLGKRTDSRLYISSEMGFIPLLFSPYFSVGMGWKA